ncbi:uncharacterized protein EAF01_008514 [Botrytis porri]|uniref:uncharacterized protein n=1 Tax=Botrytis porri TaxID=87229 RepID=UPI001900CE95|nr:uncharacterized protein EAF01_008514 [Botrytis porri]KAF7899301.1 hypothetical protein EAF01_008514 [Botrytis porri]
MHTNPPPPPYTHSSSPSSPSSSPPITQTVATSAELTELLLLRTQMREFINPILDHTPQLSQQTEQIALLEMKNQQLQTQMQMLWTEFDRRREEGHATVRERAVRREMVTLEEFVRLLKVTLVIVVTRMVFSLLWLLLKIAGVEGI